LNLNLAKYVFLHNGTQLEGEKCKFQKLQNKDHPSDGTDYQPLKNNINLGSVDIIFLGLIICNVTLTAMCYLYIMAYIIQLDSNGTELDRDDRGNLYFICKCSLINSHGITRMMLVVRIPHSDDIL